MNFTIITSINPITKSVIEFSKIKNNHVVIIGDNKSVCYEHENVTFLDLPKQKNLDLFSFKTTPYNHYSRKNLGYLYAFRKKSDLIYDTDDDTIPYKDWSIKKFESSNCIQSDLFINSFSFFTNKKCWPRGTPLSLINSQNNFKIKNEKKTIGVWQGIIDGDSDFDAIYRLTNNRHIKFKKNIEIVIDNFCYSPFNSQSTLWNKDVNCLLYIPTTVDFRFTDILRGYISQRIMWDFNFCLGFHSPNTYQIRNEHDYFKDFKGEISMYESLPRLINLLNNLDLKNKTMQESLLEIYIKLYDNKIVKKEEINNLKNWIHDYNSISK